MKALQYTSTIILVKHSSPHAIREKERRIGILPHELGEKIYKVEKGLAAFLTATTLMTGGVVGQDKPRI